MQKMMTQTLPKEIAREILHPFRCHQTLILTDLDQLVHHQQEIQAHPRVQDLCVPSSLGNFFLVGVLEYVPRPLKCFGLLWMSTSFSFYNTSFGKLGPCPGLELDSGIQRGLPRDSSERKSTKKFEVAFQVGFHNQVQKEPPRQLFFPIKYYRF